MTDFNITRNSTFITQVRYWQNSAKTIPVNLTGFTCEFIIKDDVSDAASLYNITSNSGMVITPLTGTMDITISATQTLSLKKQKYYFELALTSGPTRNIILRGSLIPQ